MINRGVLLKDLQKLVIRLEDDLRQRCALEPEIEARLKAQHDAARAAGRTALSLLDWKEEQLTQGAVSWVLSSVFVRFLEDNGLIERPLLSGPLKPVDRRKLAQEHRAHYFQRHPIHSNREYLEQVFKDVAELPGMRDLFDARHAPLWSLEVTGDGAAAIIDFWHSANPDTGELRHDFTDPEWNTRFLGDLYQDLSESARKKFALLQTPEFVEEFILDRTLEPALEDVALGEFLLIDPTCGSGHFLLGAFQRLFERWQRAEPGTNPRALAQRALDAVHGVDLNPYAAAIARFRLLIAALRASVVTRLAAAPAFGIHVLAGDSLLHGAPAAQGIMMSEAVPGSLRHAYDVEDLAALEEMLKPGGYHAVVGNPPYITVKDRALNQAYRDRYDACHGKYSLVVPFVQRFFQLAEPRAGRVGMIVANSFMKRAFGKKLVENFLRQVDLTHVVDASGAYIPGHGTPTVLFFGRNRAPVGDAVRVVMGTRGEPSTPTDPAQGLVWTAILRQIDVPGSEGPWVSVTDVPRSRLASHPWSIGGGGAAELKEALQDASDCTLRDITSAIGVMAILGEEEVFQIPSGHLALGERARFGKLVVGDDVRDWALESCPCLLPYDTAFRFDDSACPARHLFVYRTVLRQTIYFGQSREARGLDWREYAILVQDKLRAPLSIVFAFVATHNHFVLDRGGKIFKQSAPVMKLIKGSTEDDHLGLLGLLNSSSACFWLKQVCQNRGSTVDDRGARQRTAPFEDFYEIGSTLLEKFPLPVERPLQLAISLDDEGAKRIKNAPSTLVASGAIPTADLLRCAQRAETSARFRAVSLQEELDWWCYRAYGLLLEDLCHVGDDLPGLDLGERAFEIVLARRVGGGEEQTTWFERHRSRPITEIPAHWPAAYRALVQRRIDVIERNRDVALIERPEYKRRWVTEPWEEQVERALRKWLLERLEREDLWCEPVLTSTARLARVLRGDADFMSVAALYRDDPEFDVERLVAELVEPESVPCLPSLRYTSSGLRKRERWEATWDLQRAEDRIDARTQLAPNDPAHLKVLDAKALKASEVGPIDPPPKYKSEDFLKGDYWRLRGKLDVPKERFVSYPHCSRDTDPSLVIAWAGWDHLQHARALATYFQDMKEREGWPKERLQPLLAGIQELLPWLKQWHDELDPEYGVRMGDYFASFVESEARALGFTLDDLRNWRPPQLQRKPRGRRARGKEEA